MMRSTLLVVCLWAAAAFGGAAIQSRLTEPPAVQPVVAELPAAVEAPPCCGDFCPCDGCECVQEECLAPVAPNLQEPPTATRTVAAPPAPHPVTGGVYRQPAYTPQVQYVRQPVYSTGPFGRRRLTGYRNVPVYQGYQGYQSCGPGG